MTGTSEVGGQQQQQIPFARCCGCSRGFAKAEWLALPLIQNVAGSVVAGFVRGWPSEVSIDVRRCPECQQNIARRRPNDPEQAR
jgi:hypothetical protein